MKTFRHRYLGYTAFGILNGDWVEYKIRNEMGGFATKAGIVYRGDLHVIQEFERDIEDDIELRVWMHKVSKP